LLTVGVVACVVVLPAGCGGDSEKKSDGGAGSTKTVSGWAAAFTKAAKAGDCKALKELAPNLTCDVKTALGQARVVARRRFGSGAVVEFEGARYEKQRSDRAQLILVQKSDGAWVATLDSPDASREVGTKASSVKPFEDVAAKWISAVAEGDCKTAFKYAAANQTPEAYCKQAVGAKTPQRQVLAANPPSAPERLGGTANIQFLRYTLQLPKSVDPKGGTTYATLAAIHVSKRALTQGATNPYLVGEPFPGPTPPAIKTSTGGYTEAVRSTYVKNCVAGGESKALCGCQIEMISAAVPYPDFKTPTERFDAALPGVKKSCRVSSQSGGSADEKKVTQVVLGGDLVPGWLCSPTVSTERLVPKLEGSREKCYKVLGGSPPDKTIKVTDVSVTGDKASAKGTDQQGHFGVKLVRQGSSWLVDDFVNEGA
jgi:hypothetical protein